jgi:hypothetical protein
MHTRAVSPIFAGGSDMLDKRWLDGILFALGMFAEESSRGWLVEFITVLVFVFFMFRKEILILSRL